MDYKYIEQLLERYWEGETTLQEEAILRAFFSQEDVPAGLMKYKSLFDCGLQEETLGDDFDARILSSIGEEEEPKTKIVTLASRLKPLFKAAAIVAILLTIGNAAQAPWNYGWDNPKDEYAAVGRLLLGHYSSRYDDEGVLLDEARRIFPEAYLTHENDIFNL